MPVEGGALHGRGAVSHHCRHAIVSQQGDILEGVRERPEVVRRSWLKEYVPEHRSKMLARVDKMVMGKDEPTWEQSTKHKGFTAGAHFVEFRCPQKFCLTGFSFLSDFSVHLSVRCRFHLCFALTQRANTRYCMVAIDVK